MARRVSRETVSRRAVAECVSRETVSGRVIVNLHGMIVLPCGAAPPMRGERRLARSSRSANAAALDHVRRNALGDHGPDSCLVAPSCPKTARAIRERALRIRARPRSPAKAWARSRSRALTKIRRPPVREVRSTLLKQSGSRLRPEERVTFRSNLNATRPIPHNVKEPAPKTPAATARRTRKNSDPYVSFKDILWLTRRFIRSGSFFRIAASAERSERRDLAEK